MCSGILLQHSHNTQRGRFVPSILFLCRPSKGSFHFVVNCSNTEVYSSSRNHSSSVRNLVIHMSTEFARNSKFEKLCWLKVLLSNQLTYPRGFPSFNSGNQKISIGLSLAALHPNYQLPEETLVSRYIFKKLAQTR
jgi:hypothetical protein